MKAIFILATLLFVCVSSNGQVRKCKGPDGKITYSDTLCSTNTVSESGVQTNANTMDASTLRQDMSREKAEALEAADRRQTEAAVNRAMQAGSSSCKFSYLAIGDEKGKQLADAAKQECLMNIQAKAKGQPISLEQFTYWNSHHQLTTTRRQAAVTRSEVNRTAQETNQRIDSHAREIKSEMKNKSYECRPNFSGTSLDCR